jgi:hypothetical protein
MIISAPAAIRIISSHAILQTVPELLAPVEAYSLAERQWKGKANCKDCEKAKIFASVEEQALKAIINLPSDAVRRLREYLGQGDLYVYVPVPGSKPQIKQLK